MPLLAEMLEDHLIAEDRVEPRVANKFLEVLLRVAVAQVAHDVPHVRLLLGLFLIHRWCFAHYLDDGLEVPRWEEFLGSFVDQASDFSEAIFKLSEK